MTKICVVLCLVLFSSIEAHAAPLQDVGYMHNVKAVCIYNFTKYIDWMDDDASSTFDIAVVGESAIVDPLVRIAQKQRVRNKEIRIRHFQNADQIDRCHILFVPESQQTQLKPIVDKIRGKNILIVSEIEGGLDIGVMINFLFLQETIKFEINLRDMKKAGFAPGSELLKLAVRLIE